MDSQAPLHLTDQVIESLRPALVFKSFVRSPQLVKHN